YLDKPEPSLAVVGAVGIYLAAHFLRRLRQNAAADWRGAVGWLLRTVGWLVGGFLAIWLPVFIFLWSQGGLAYALLGADYVPYSVVHSPFRQSTLTSYVVQGIFGSDHLWDNFLSQLEAGAWLVLDCVALVVATRGWHRQKRWSEGWWTMLLVVIVVGAVGAYLGYRANYWVDIGHALVFPVTVAALGAVGWCVWRAWRPGEDISRPLVLAVVGVAASLMLVRIFLKGTIGHYGFYLMPLAALFCIHCVMVEAGRPRIGEGKPNALLPMVFSLLVLFGAGWLARGNLSVYAVKNYPVGSGRDRFYTFSPDDFADGYMLNTMIQMFHEQTPGAKTLAAFPEGIAVNYHLRVPTPLAELEFNPSSLSYVGPEHILDELRSHPPEAAFLYYRDFSEYGVKAFGDSPASGSGIVDWLKANYIAAEIIQPTAGIPHDHDVVLLVPRTAASVPEKP
ncbi:MAG TPA: hypothetical protein VK737_02065, partial [Opitutales bacterium]|nr:hypothetical protein [Opitutales bacterium]